ncbi:terminase small subunit [Porticoccus sp.]
MAPKEANFVVEYVKDFSARRAAECSGYSPDYGHQLLQKDHIDAAVQHILAQRLEASHIDAEWLLMEAADNHFIARQQGNINASNSALTLIAKHVAVDALAANKVDVDVTSGKEIAARLQRWRQRVGGHESKPDEEPSFL